ncbi:hypothetical protein MYCTH_2300101 [Thermothelomyces thermophilus ATCC 42464]|uniref:Uncharacterized protein n=1 Tax=Thermothelomyces thermophilus (strain ATCC 42464 / BCRC 31852 / DSM 1799) TaxID=573729 RepID=G2QAF2_THET4|nr:uncharacterized protein MYCTH_2300101 [Thermothelomyces thermophilus ATCC 42464]AEO55848.1 hypothetical protein MYCTH_2300101 [Thermothelomyces thermophilus ATCC 42464]
MEASPDSIFLSSGETTPSSRLSSPAESHSSSSSSSNRRRRSKSSQRHRRRPANVFDAVAGRVTLNGALGDADDATSRSKRRLRAISDRYLSRNPRLAPEEALFRRKNAPVRYAEYDIYWASDDLPNAGYGSLPDSDLLRSIHSYASKFYETAAARLGPRCVVGTRTVDERSMDESALLAFGILLEEAGREALGKRGDVVFTEASTEAKEATKVVQSTKSPCLVSGGFEAADEPPVSHTSPKPKRRKVANTEISVEEHQ